MQLISEVSSGDDLFISNRFLETATSDLLDGSSTRIKDGSTDDSESHSALQYYQRVKERTSGTSDLPISDVKCQELDGKRAITYQVRALSRALLVEDTA